MSAGPIKVWRDSWKPPEVSTGAAGKTWHAPAVGKGARAVCGRKSVVFVTNLEMVTCSDCLAALRADAEVPGS